MTVNRRTTVLIVSAVVFTMLLSGTAAGQQAASFPLSAGLTTAEKSGRITVADLDSALASGPVFIEFESKECAYCKQQRPVSEALASQYSGKVTFLFADKVESRELANAFQVRGVPQIDVIARKADGQYTCIGQDGTPSNSIPGTRFIGMTESKDLKTALDAAVRMRGQ